MSIIMKLIIENWRHFVNEEDSANQDEEMYLMWLKALEDVGVIELSSEELAEAKKDDDYTDEEALPLRALPKFVPDKVVYKKKDGKITDQPEVADDEGRPAALPTIHLNPEFLPDDKNSGFCQYNPQIYDFAIKSAENFAKVFIFVFATIRIDWPSLVPFYKNLVDFMEKYGELPTTPGRQEKIQLAGYEWISPYTWKQATVGKGENKRLATNKDGTPKMAGGFSKKVRDILSTMLGLDEAHKGDILYPELKLDNERDRKELIQIANGISKLSGAPSTNSYNLVWQNRDKIYAEFKKAVDNNIREDPTEFYKFLLTLEGLAVPKAGFVIQLLIGRLGCIDSINQAMVYSGEFPKILTKSIASNKQLGKVTNQMHEMAISYKKVLEEIKNTVETDESQYLWDLWCKLVAFQINNPRASYSVRINKPGTDEPITIQRAKSSLYSISSVENMFDYLGLPKDTKLTQMDIARHHLEMINGIISGPSKSSKKRRFENKKSKITKTRLKQIIKEELTKQDKTDVKKMVEKELEKLLQKKDTKDQVGEIVKKIMKKLYKDLSLEHPYIIDRIKI